MKKRPEQMNYFDHLRVNRHQLEPGDRSFEQFRDNQKSPIKGCYTRRKSLQKIPLDY